MKPKFQAYEIGCRHFVARGHMPCLDPSGVLTRTLAEVIARAPLERPRKLVVFGHASDEASTELNYDLSQRRGMAVRALLNNDNAAWKLASFSASLPELSLSLAGVAAMMNWKCDTNTLGHLVEGVPSDALAVFQEMCLRRYRSPVRVDGLPSIACWHGIYCVLTELVHEHLKEHHPELVRDQFGSWLAPTYGHLSGLGVFPCGSSFRSAEVNIFQSTRRVDLVYLPADLVLHPSAERGEKLTVSDVPIYRDGTLQRIAANSFVCKQSHEIGETMKPITSTLIAVGALLLAMPLQARSLVKFKAGTPAVADSINANFELLNSRIDSVAKNNGTGAATDLATIRKSLDTAYLGYKTNPKIAPNINANQIIVKPMADTTNMIMGPHVSIGARGLSFHEGPFTGYYFGLDDVSGIRISVGINTYLAVRTSYLELPSPVQFGDDVKFKSKMSDFKISGTTFENASSVPNIDSLSAYISTNKNLPGMPTQAQIDSEGFSLIEMNKVLIKRLEEMSTYIINQERRIKALEAKP